MPVFIGTRGRDTITTPYDGAGPEGLRSYVLGYAGDDVINAGIYSDRDLLDPVSYRSVVFGGAGDDEISSVFNIQSFWGERAPGDDLTIMLHGGTGNDSITAGYVTSLSMPEGEAPSARIDLSGGGGNDRIEIYAQAPDVGEEPPNPVGPYIGTLEGNQGSDTLIGSNGADRLIGGQGDDFLRGRGGEDTFVFGSIRDGERDRVLDFTIGEDVIDISGIDANTYRRGNQSFTFSNADEFHGTGLVWVEDRGATTVVYADNGPDLLRVLIRDGWGVDADDYGAGDFLL